MTLHNDLLVDINPRKTLFLTLEGQPVWPILNKQDLSALTELTKIFSSQVKIVQGIPKLELEEVGSEVVVGLGEGVETAARLYAHLTLRKYQNARGLRELANIANTVSLAVVVTTSKWLTSQLMNIMYSSNLDAPAPGVICAADSATLHRQVLLRSAATLLDGALKFPRIDILPDSSIAKLTTSSHEILGAEAAESDIETALRRNAGVLTVFTHSDGIDASLHKNLVLCPMDKMPIVADKFRSPRCIVTGYCHRQEKSVAEAIKSAALISPDAIAARILIFNVCWGLLQPKGEIDPAWGLGYRLLNSSTLGAIVTSWEIIQSKQEDIDILARTLLCGKSIGEALAQYNRSLTSRKWDQKMCLLGDPRVRLPIMPQTNQYKFPTGNSSNDSLYSKVSFKDLEELNFIRACLTTTISSCSKKDILASAKESLEAVRLYEYAFWTGGCIEGDGETLGTIMRDTVLKYLFHQWIFQNWLPFVHECRTIKASMSCFGCGRLTKTIVASLRIPKVSKREITFCPHCGLIRDVPIKTDIKFSIKNGDTVQLEGQIPSEHCTIGLHILSDLPSDCKLWKWPIDNNGKPAQFFKPLEKWPVGPLSIAVIILWKGNLAIVSQMGRSAAGGSVVKTLNGQKTL